MHQLGLDWLAIGVFLLQHIHREFFVGIYADCVLMIKVVCEDDDDDDKGGEDDDAEDDAVPISSWGIAVDVL